MLRARAREALGQYPQARRDCHKVVTKLSAKPGTQDSVDAAETTGEAIEKGMQLLRQAGLDDPGLERVYEVTGTGVLVRRRIELRDLGREGRSVKRERLEAFNARVARAEREAEAERREKAEELDRFHLKRDKVRATIQRARDKREKMLEKERQEAQRRKREEERARKEAAIRKALENEARERVEMRKCDAESRINSKLSEKAEAAEEKKLEEEEDEDIAALTKGRRGAPPKKGDGKKKKKKKKPGDGGGKEK